MKIILRDDVEKLGKTGEVLEVKDGYARNYLLPRNLAIPATQGNLRAIDQIHRQKAGREQKRQRESLKLKEAIEKVSLTAEVLVGEEDRLFGSVTALDIAELLARQGITIDRHKIELEEPIKALGVYSVPVRLAHDVTAEVKLWVMKKEQEAEA
jgi:large subunit ribosomal protein L9